jgi:hypothetical protein
MVQGTTQGPARASRARLAYLALLSAASPDGFGARAWVVLRSAPETVPAGRPAGACLTCAYVARARQESRKVQLSLWARYLRASAHVVRWPSLSAVAFSQNSCASAWSLVVWFVAWIWLEVLAY